MKYKVIYDDSEQALNIDIEGMFGSKLADRLEPPGRDSNGNAVYSNTIQDVEYFLWKAIEESKETGVPFIYVGDSVDAWTTDDELKRTEEALEAHEKGKEAKGSYKMDKAKYLGEMLRKITPELKKTGSILILISQTRDDINPMSFTKKTRSGGNALRFYATHEMWLAVEEKLRVGKDRTMIGIVSKVKVSKNKLTGKERIVKFPIYYSYGVDSIGSGVDYLIDQGVWEKKKETIIAKELGIEATRNKLITQIEENGLEDKLNDLVEKRWGEVEEHLKEAVPHKKKKYE